MSLESVVCSVVLATTTAVLFAAQCCYDLWSYVVSRAELHPDPLPCPRASLPGRLACMETVEWNVLYWSSIRVVVGYSISTNSYPCTGLQSTASYNLTSIRHKQHHQWLSLCVRQGGSLKHTLHVELVVLLAIKG
eukprot:scpid90891/ scgid19170/ 